MRYRIFFLLTAIQTLTLLGLVGFGKLASSREAPVRYANRQLVQALDLTDLALWTGARYTRHVSQADLFAAFQDSMGALEHFPEGALSPLPTIPVQVPDALAKKRPAHEPTS